MQNSGRQTGDLSTVLVANEKNLVALVTVLVAISSPAHFWTPVNSERFGVRNILMNLRIVFKYTDRLL